MSAARWDAVVSSIALAPALLLGVRHASRRMVPEADPRVMMDIERSALPGQVLVALFAAALLCSGTLALARRRGVRGELLVGGSLLAGFAATVVGAWSLS